MDQAYFEIKSQFLTVPYYLYLFNGDRINFSYIKSHAQPIPRSRWDEVYNYLNVLDGIYLLSIRMVSVVEWQTEQGKNYEV